MLFYSTNIKHVIYRGENVTTLKFIVINMQLYIILCKFFIILFHLHIIKEKRKTNVNK